MEINVTAHPNPSEEIHKGRVHRRKTYLQICVRATYPEDVPCLALKYTRHHRRRHSSKNGWEMIRTCLGLYTGSEWVYDKDMTYVCAGCDIVTALEHAFNAMMLDFRGQLVKGVRCNESNSHRA